MKKSVVIMIRLLTLIVFTLFFKLDTCAASGNLVPLPDGYSYYAKTTCPVFAFADVNSPVLISVDIDTRLPVTGYLDTGYFMVDLGQPQMYYVAAACVRMQCDIPTNEEALKKVIAIVADAYSMHLEANAALISRFGIKDLTGDGIPELIYENGHEVFTIYNNRAVSLFYTETDMSYYYAAKEKLCAGLFYKDGKENWQIFTVSDTVLPWGQMTCAYPGLAGYQKDQFKKVECNLSNDANQRQKLYETLYSMALAGSL